MFHFLQLFHTWPQTMEQVKESGYELLLILRATPDSDKLPAKTFLQGLAMAGAIDIEQFRSRQALYGISAFNPRFLPLVSTHRQLLHFFQWFQGFEAPKMKQLAVETISRTQFRILKKIGKINVIKTVTINYKCPKNKITRGHENAAFGIL